MRIKLNNTYKRHKHASWLTSFDPNGDTLKGKDIHVIAVMKSCGVLSYLICASESYSNTYLEWVNAKFFDIVDVRKPSNWIEYRWNIFHPYVISKKDYDFSFRITYYAGPECILNNTNFLFDVIENHREAMAFYMKSLVE